MPDLDRLEAAVDLILRREPRLGATKLVAVDGPSGSGKTVLAARLAGLLRARGLTVASLSTDLLATWDLPFDWWPDLETGVLRPLSTGRSGRLTTVAWPAGRPAPGPTITVEPTEVLVLEGVSSGRRAVADRLSVLLWVEVPDAADRLARAVARDGEASRDHLLSWQRAETAFYSSDDVRRHADLVIPG